MCSALRRFRLCRAGVRYAEAGDKAGNTFINKKGDESVHACLDEIKQQDEGHKAHQRADRFPIERAHHKIGCDDEIGEEHHRHHRRRSEGEGRRRAAARAVAAVNEGGDEHVDPRCKDVHDDAVNAARGADGEALNERGDRRHDQSRRGTEGEADDQNRDIRRVIFEERHGGEDREMDECDEHHAERGEHAERGDALCSGFAAVHNAVLPPWVIE